MHCWEPFRSLAAAAAAASLSAAAAAVGFVVGHVAGRLADGLLGLGLLGLVLHGEQLVGGCWLLHTLCQWKAKTCCRFTMVVIVIVQGREVSSRTKPLRNKSLSDSINAGWTTKKWYRERI